MLKKIDVYILKKFLGTFFYSISLIILIMIVFDISEKLDDFLQKDAPLKEIVFSFYLNWIPYMVNLFSPLFTFIAVIFFTSKMASDTEIVAILSSGVSFKRMMRPYFIASGFLALLSLVLSNFVIPHANKRRIDFEEIYVKNPYHNQDINIHRQISPGVFIYMERFDNQENIGTKFSLEKYEQGKLTLKLLSESIKWDTATSKWTINNYFIRYIENMAERTKIGSRIDSTFNFTPKDFGRKENKIETMNYAQLNNFIAEEKMKGSGNIESYEIEKHKRIAFPFATFILTLIGVSLASRKTRGGIGLHIGLGLLISFSFILFMQVSSTFATSGPVKPYVAVWIPNIAFGILGLYLLKRAPK
jgi:lipopolysaccharide export system permease protein